jgi:hypothetical protein
VRAAALLLGLVVLAPARAALADPSAPDQPQPAVDASERTVDRTWLYLDDARVAAPLTVVGMTNASYTNAGPSLSRVASPFASPYRAFAANTAQPGGMVAAGGEVGLLPRVSVMALGQMGFGSDAAGTNAGAVAGLRFQLLPSSFTHTHLVASVGYLREAWSGPFYDGDANKWYPGSPSGDNGAWLQAAFSGDIGRARLATTVHGEHVFANGRDPLDVMVQAGASYRVVGELRAGVEYVGQDLEEVGTAGAEGGARHFAGPTASMQLMGDRLTVVGGPSVGLSASSPRLLGRVAVAYAF